MRSGVRRRLIAATPSAQGRIADALTMFEDAWQRADKIDDPIACALVTAMGGSCCATLYDYAKAEQWCARELTRSRSRLVANYRFGLIHLLASARMSQGDIGGARGLLGEFEGGASKHYLLAFHEGDWERAVVLRRMELEAERAAGRLEGVANCASLLGRFARLANLRGEAQAYLHEGLAASLAAPDRNRELFIRIELAVVNADQGELERALEHLARCREIINDGEDWRGHRGAFAYAAATVEEAVCLARDKGLDLVWAIPAQRNRPLSKGYLMESTTDSARRSRSSVAIMRRGKRRAHWHCGRGYCSRPAIIAVRWRNLIWPLRFSTASRHPLS